MVIYFITIYAISLLLSYDLKFTRATLEIGRSISDTDSKRGFQDAITHPWSTTFGLITYAITLVGLGFGWLKYGWLVGLCVTVVFFLIVVINNHVIMPKSDSEHFRRIIIRSMIRRYANYKKSGDELRASSMKMLLERLDIPVSEFEDRLSSDNKRKNDN